MKTIRNISNIESLNTDIQYSDGRQVFIKAGQAIDIDKFDKTVFEKSLKDGMIGKMIKSKWLIIGETINGTAVNTTKLEDEAKIEAAKIASELKAVEEEKAKIEAELKKELEENNPILS
jgi:hypothetical protein